MYLHFYHLSKKPFELTPDPTFMFRSRKHQKALSYLEYGLTENVGFLLLTGDVGSGKTTTAKCIIQDLGRGFVTSFISNTHASSGQMLRMILNGFGLPARKLDKAAARDLLERFLLTMHQRGKRTLLVIDEAQNLSFKALEEVRMLSNFQNERNALIQVLLIGQPELLEALKTPAMRQLAQRVAVHFHLTGLDRLETAAYIAYRLQIAGGRSDLFTAAAVDKIHDMACGIPRLINLICQAALVYGFADESPVVSQDTILQIASDNLGIGITTVTDDSTETHTAPADAGNVDRHAARLTIIEREIKSLKTMMAAYIRGLEALITSSNANLIRQLVKVAQRDGHPSEPKGSVVRLRQ